MSRAFSLAFSLDSGTVDRVRRTNTSVKAGSVGWTPSVHEGDGVSVGLGVWE